MARSSTRAASKRNALPADDHADELDADDEEKVLDPKLASSPDVPDDQMDGQPAKKKRKQAPARVGGGGGGKDDDSVAAQTQSGKKIDYAQSETVGFDNKPRPVKRNDFNPSSKLPQNPTPTDSLRQVLGKAPAAKGKGHVVYWMRMRDARIEDNRALAKASELVQSHGSGKHLVALFVLSPGDYRAHDRSPRRIDLMLRQLRILQKQFEDELHIPFYVVSQEPRTAVPEKVLQFCKEWGASHVVGNIEHEVDELWRDIKTVELAPKDGIHADFVDDTYVVPPGRVNTKDGRPYSVFSPWNRAWVDVLLKNPDLLEESPKPKANDQKSITADKSLNGLFGSKIPAAIEGFECKDTEYMQKLWPAGTEAAHRVLENFVAGKGGLQVLDGAATDYSDGKTTEGPNAKDSRLARYQTGRNLMSENGSSRISPYLSAGIISARAVLRRTRSITNNKLVVGRDSGPAAYNTEIGFRDFYGHVLAAWPRVCMGHAYITKYEDVVWEYDESILQAWREGRTGFPIVDAAMRQGAKQGYMHNRGRMVVAMVLVKILGMDWREGERWFMMNFIDGDFASNNGGWQWSASTGTDPQPYFRIFNPLSQSEKCDPSGDYIRHWVPELANVKGNAVHAPHERLSEHEFAKLNYPTPIVDYKFGRQRALHRFKNVGEA